MVFLSTPTSLNFILAQYLATLSPHRSLPTRPPFHIPAFHNNSPDLSSCALRA